MPEVDLTLITDLAEQLEVFGCRPTMAARVRSVVAELYAARALRDILFGGIAEERSTGDGFEFRIRLNLSEVKSALARYDAARKGTQDAAS